MRKRNLLVTLPLLLAGCAPPPVDPAAALTPAPEVVSAEATPVTDGTPIIEGTPAPTSLELTPIAGATPAVDVTPGATVVSTPSATATPKSSQIILPTPTNVAPTPTPIPRNARQEVANFGGQLEKALLKEECARVASEVTKRSAFYEEVQYACEKDNDRYGAAYCQKARGALDKMVLACQTKTEILKGERYHTQMANVEQMIQDAISVAP